MSVRPAVTPDAGGVMDALRALVATLQEMVHVRGALVAIELREEVRRRAGMLVLAVAGVALLHAALMLVTLLVAVAFWDSHRMAAIASMAALYAVGGAAAFVWLRHAAATSPPPFASSRRELAEDIAQWRAQ